jgi:NAD-dependent deacetylase
MLPEDVLNQAFRVTESCNLFMSIGTSALVYPAASLPGIAKKSGAYVVEVNPEPTGITGMVDEYLMGKSGEILPKLVKTVFELDIAI